MRILVIANLPPYVLGGAENQVARLVEAWVELGYGIEVVGHRIPDGVLHHVSAEIPTHHIAVRESAGRGGRAASYFFSLASLLRKIKRNFDVIYCRGLGDGAISICVLKAIGEVRLPMLACPINAKGAGDSHFIRSIPFWRLLLRVINRHCDAINVIAPAIWSDLAELGIHGPRIAHIPNGIRVGAPIPKSHVASIRRLVWVGRLTAQKGIDVLLEALAKVVAAGREFNLEIIGSGPDMALLVKQSRQLGLERRVRFTGALAKEAIRAKLADMDVFLLPSRYEGMSNAALEAMEVGLPLLLTRCGGIDTYVDESIGWICEPDRVDAMSSELLRMLDTPADKLLAMGKKARLLVERNFQIEKVAQQNADLLKQLLKASRH
jgi:glycosyltransferase involved in cell wall biosynthesis